MRARCKICSHPRGADIVAMYFAIDSLRKAASLYQVSFKTLHRHIQNCLAQIGLEKRETSFQTKLRLESIALMEELNSRYNAPRLDKRRPRPKPIITKPVEFTWSRRGWKRKNPC